MANSARGSVTVKTNATKIQNVNVSPTPPNDGDTLVYNEAEAKYEPAPGGGGSGDATTIQGIPVTETPPEHGQILAFNGDDNILTWITPPFNPFPAGPEVISGLQLWLKAADVTDTAWPDSSGYGRDATVYGSPSPGTVAGRDCLPLDGDGQYAAVADFFDSSASYTLCAVVRHTQVSSNSNNTIFCQAASYLPPLYVRAGEPSGEVAFSIQEYTSGGSPQYITSTAIAPTSWYLLTCVYDAEEGENRLYINGGLADTTSVTDAFNASGELLIGSFFWVGTLDNTFDGAVGDVLAYNRALTDGEVEQLTDFYGF